MRKNCKVTYFWESRRYDYALEEFKPAHRVEVGDDVNLIFQSILQIHRNDLINPDIERGIVTGENKSEMNDDLRSPGGSELRYPVDWFILHLVQNNYDAFKTDLHKQWAREKANNHSYVPIFEIEEDEASGHSGGRPVMI